MKSIVSPRRRGSDPSLADVVGALREAGREIEGFATDERVLRAYVHALERLYPDLRFAMRLSKRGVQRGPIVQATTPRVAPEATDEICITEA